MMQPFYHTETNPQRQEGTGTLLLEEQDREHHIILHNDDVNTFDHVIECLIEICEHTPVQAEQCSYIVHYKGKCDVKHGSLDDLKPRCSALLEQGLSAEVV